MFAGEAPRPFRFTFECNGELRAGEGVGGNTLRTDRDDPTRYTLERGAGAGDTLRARAFVPAVHGFRDTIRDALPTTRILVVSSSYCPSAESRPGPARPGPTRRDRNDRVVTAPGMASLRAGCLTLIRIRELLAGIVAERSDAHLGYLSGLEPLGAADAADLPDDLHPNAVGYIRMGERFAALAFGPGGFPAAG